MAVEVVCESPRGGCAKLGDVTCSFAVTKVGDLPEPEVLYVWVPLPNGNQIQLFVNRETCLVVVDEVYADESGGYEHFRKTLRRAQVRKSGRKPK